MSRTIRSTIAYRSCFPRVSGDEPANDAAVSVPSEFSPRERG